MLGLPNIHKVFTEEIIKIVMENPPLTIIFIVSILKILFTIMAFCWIIKLVENLLERYKANKDGFWDIYTPKLIITACLTFSGMALIILWICN